MNWRRLGVLAVSGSVAAAVVVACQSDSDPGIEVFDASVVPIDDDGGNLPDVDGAALVEGGADGTTEDAATPDASDPVEAGNDASVDSGDGGSLVVDSGIDSGIDSGADAADARSPIALTSTRFTSGGAYPALNTCGAAFADPGGWHDSPPLTWTSGPAGTASYAVVILDTNNANAVHWAIYDLASNVLALPSNIPVGAAVAMPVVAKQGDNAFSMGTPARAFAYFGPCPQPFGTMHTYQVKVYALDVAALVTTPANPVQVVADLEAHKLETAAITFVATSPP